MKQIFVLSAFLNVLFARQVGGDHLLAVLLGYAGYPVLVKRHSDEPQLRPWHQGKIDQQGQFYSAKGEHIHYRDIRSVQIGLPSVSQNGSNPVPYFWGLSLPLREDSNILNDLRGRQVRWRQDICQIEAFIYTSQITGAIIYPDYLENAGAVPFGRAVVFVGNDRPLPIGDLANATPLCLAGDPNILPHRRSRENFQLLR